MPIFTAGAAAIAGAIGFTAGTTGFLIAQSLIAAGLAAGVGHLTGAFDQPSLPAVEDPGVEQRLAANTQNRVPALYGQFMQRGSVVYLEVTEDRKTLYTVLVIGEGPITSIDKIYWDDILLTLDADGNVTGGVDVEGNATDRLNDNVLVQTYLGGATGNFSTYLSGVSTAWTSTHAMTGLAYAVITVNYNRDDDVVGLSDMRFIGTAPISDPATAVMDQLTNTRYGLGLPTSAIDTASFAEAKTYFDTQLPYTTNTGTTAMARRFEINGSINTADPVFERIEAMLLGSNSSLRWQNGKYSIFINKADTIESFVMDASRVIGDIQVTEVGLNQVINQVEVRYGRDPDNNYQRNTATVTLPTANMYPNEIRRVRTVDLPLVRTFVEAERLAYILMNQSREQLSVKHMATVECMALEAGDVIQYTLANYGWNKKQFRVIRVSEIEQDGTLQYEIEAVEYAASVYTDRTHIQPGASPNSNIPPIDAIPAVTDLVVSGQFPNESDPYFSISWTVPPSALIEGFTVFVNPVNTTFDDGNTYSLGTLEPTGSSFTAGETLTHNVLGLPEGSYNLWVVGRNDFASSAQSNTVSLLGWSPDANAEIRTEVVRHHDNPVAEDPGAPTGISGTGGGWYDPVEGSVIGENKPTDPDPHWEARAFASGEIVPGTNNIKRFTFSGTSADAVSGATSLSEKVTRFFVQGFNPGRRAETTPAAAWEVDFAFAGTSVGGGSDPDNTNITLTIDDLAFSVIDTFEMTNTEIATLVATRFNQRAEYTATASFTTVTVTAAANGPSNRPGAFVSDPGTDPSSTNPGTLSITEVIETTGTDAVFTGDDALISFRIDGVPFTTVNVSDSHAEEIATTISSTFGARSEYTGTKSQAFVAVVTNTEPGDINTPTIELHPGITASGNPSDLTVRTTVENRGTTTITADGEFTTITVTIGEESMTQEVSASASSIAIAIATAAAINENTTRYTAVADSGVVTATSTFTGSAPDITITVNPGENQNGSTPTIEVAETVVQAGMVATFNLSDANWEYYVINREVRVDGDTTMMGADGSVAVRRGLILSVDAEDGSSGPTGGFNDDNLALITDSFTTSEFRNNLLITGNITFKVTEFNTTGVNVFVVIRLEASLDGGTTWGHIGSSPTVRVGTLNNSDNGLRYSLSMPFSDASENSAGSEDLQLRFNRVWFTTPSGASTPQTIVAEPTQANATNFSYSVLVMEEQLQPT